MGYQPPQYTAVELDSPLLPANWRQGETQAPSAVSQPDPASRRRRKEYRNG